LQEERQAGIKASASKEEIDKRLAAITEEHNKKGASAIKAYNKELTDQQKLIGELSGLSSMFYKDWESRNKQYAQGRISLDAQEKAQAKLLAKQPFSIALAKEEAEATKARVKAYEADLKRRTLFSRSVRSRLPRWRRPFKKRWMKSRPMVLLPLRASPLPRLLPKLQWRGRRMRTSKPSIVEQMPKHFWHFIVNLRRARSLSKRWAKRVCGIASSPSRNGRSRGKHGTSDRGKFFRFCRQYVGGVCQPVFHQPTDCALSLEMAQTSKDRYGTYCSWAAA
jgi:hypothetical protein